LQVQLFLGLSIYHKVSLGELFTSLELSCFVCRWAASAASWCGSWTCHLSGCQAARSVVLLGMYNAAEMY